MNNLLNKKILMVICGGISAYKSLEIIRGLKKNNAQINRQNVNGKWLCTSNWYIFVK